MMFVFVVKSKNLTTTKHFLQRTFHAPLFSINHQNPRLPRFFNTLNRNHNFDHPPGARLFAPSDGQYTSQLIGQTLTKQQATAARRRQRHRFSGLKSRIHSDASTPHARPMARANTFNSIAGSKMFDCSQNNVHFLLSPGLVCGRMNTAIPCHASTPFATGGSMKNDTAADRAKSFADSGFGHLKTASYDAALDAFAEAARLCEQAGDKAGEATQRMIMADICFATGRQGQALDIYREVLAILRPDADKARIAAVQNNIGLLLSRLQRHAEAMAAFGEARAGFQACGQTQRAAEQLGNMGSLCRDRQAYEDALNYYQQALEMFEEMALAEKIADQHANIGYIHAMRGDKDAGLLHFEQALTLYRQSGNQDKALETQKNIDTLNN
ncbi:tetratricopeptide repeat protein [Syntrophotalea acetylenica]|nr:tetratricopeptide repeat protein [Syntrophotalea acetylenica]MDY0263047.1 tetratricopeptide repeat protein [Syntrophotalea acetylenica]